jgi:translation initiation factor IF-3
MATDRAKALAVEREMDLVEVAPQAQPPVARIMDYGKFKFESIKKEKDGRRKHNVIKVKEMKLRPKIGEHDFQTKFHAVKSFLEEGDKVKLTIMFRGREMVHQDIGRRLLERVSADLGPHAVIEQNPLMEGKQMVMVFAPKKK